MTWRESGKDIRVQILPLMWFNWGPQNKDFEGH